MKWKQRQANPLSEELIEQFHLTDLQAKLFALRGNDTADKLDFWLNANEYNLADPYLMHDMQKAIDRINQAIDHNERITIYGDYDADGITATAIMVETLEILGADVHFFIPDRFKDGYGPSMQRYQEIVADGTNLIITVDNGVTGVKEVQYAKSKGVDTIITDHHTFQAEKPDAAYAIVHCNYPGQAYPFDDYCGAGVAYTIARALMDDPMSDMLDLAMIGTIGDMVKVNDEGHIIVKRGLEILNNTQRPGLRALIKNAGLTLGNITATDVGFAIAPRLNAVGRLDHASLAVELLLSDDEQQSQKIADQIEELNNRRKELTQLVYEKCLSMIKSNGWQHRKTLVLVDDNFHEGVLGLVANKIVEATRKPTIVLTKGEDGNLKGSGRSIEGYNLFDALEPLNGSILTQFGGHDLACGLSLDINKLGELRERFESDYHVETNLKVKEYDFELSLNKLTPETIKEMNLVGPFGTANVEPIFSITDPIISHFTKIGKDKNHVRFTTKIKAGSVQTIGFNKAYLSENLLPYIHQLFVTLSLNQWNKKTSVQAMIKGINFQSPKLVVPAPVIDLRNEKYIMGFADRYLLFDKENYSLARDGLGINEERLTLVDEYNNNGEVAVLLDTPHNQLQLNTALEKDYQQLYLRFLLNKLPISQIPSKDSFGRTLKYIYSHPQLTPQDYRQVAPFLSLSYDSVLFILRVFFELKFVKYEEGKIVPVSNPQKQPLTGSKYYQSVSSQIEFTNKLKTMPFNQLLNYINSFK
ncbi:single-stranded-DNA-specific exonuclease [Lactobacillus colini]|uniref:Single-stranded-DNA-specific exonuclease RecJ n=1 Tax=Lactobacillus colini TaxID=1819254 RepID=A0ABS4MH02_9LACO|nr:single-stranded-DNA-specific exonuclease RecJ [Lactobacillus colini]MBP2058979.1 single-stranded-DNA-specific exonuclease [Lactobacillus colini]